VKFATWYQREPRGTYKRLHELGVGSATIYKLRKGGTIDSYALASIISEATGGEVSIAELCTKAKGQGARIRELSGAVQS
jgi:hypothetical protein